jgi:ABC-type multidrug transport system fused ATPase/permease subunit
VRRTPIVILDEPDTYLDPVARRQFWEATAEVTASRTSICIVHDLEGVGFFDRVIVMDRGRVVGAGPHSDLLESCALYRELFFPYATNGIDRRVSYGSP